MLGLDVEVKDYREFTDYLEASAKRFFESYYCPTEHGAQVDTLLNGATAKAVSTFLSSELRKHHGIFFTSESLAARVAQKIAPELSRGSSVCDPTCGAGDLLLACTRHMPRKASLEKTLELWSGKIFGQDLHPDFVRSARSRLVFSALSLMAQPHGSKSPLPQNLRYFDKLVAEDLFANSSSVGRADLIVSNPPFGQMDAPKSIKWGSGQVQMAALFIDQVIRAGRDGQRILAILPDVLRSGTRYKRWRAFVNHNARDLNLEHFGRFNREADVDVFILDFTLSQGAGGLYDVEFERPQVSESAHHVADFFKVSVGPVVPHRDCEKGPSVPYIDAKTARLWREVVPENHRNFQCALKVPPFVTLRRTSSPSDRLRLNATIVRGKQPVAVENHLLVLEPKDGKLKTCRQFMALAKCREPNDWLNQKIRCRHLTVGAIREMPSFSLKL